MRKDTHNTNYDASSFVRLATNGILAATLLLALPANAGVHLSADTRIDTYQLIEERLGGNSKEVPDCSHSEFGPHISQLHDPEVGTDVFAFHIHTAFDDDRCMIYDRQRTEITTYNAKALKNDVMVYQWRFKLDESYLPSTFWNHIFQLRPIDSVPGGNPLFTFSLLSGETEELLFYQDTGDGMKVLHRTPLEQFKGQWIDARVTAQHSLSGFIEVTLTSTHDNVTLLEWKKDDINLWLSDDTRFVLPKWGNYRSLEGTGPLRDEIVLYNDFCVAKEGESCDMLKAVNELQIGTVDPGFHVSDPGAINPFPNGRALPENNILSIFMRLFNVENTNARRHSNSAGSGFVGTDETRRIPGTYESWPKTHAGENAENPEKPRIIEFLESRLSSTRTSAAR